MSPVLQRSTRPMYRMSLSGREKSRLVCSQSAGCGTSMPTLIIEECLTPGPNILLASFCSAVVLNPTYLILLNAWESDALKASGPFGDRQPPGNEIGMGLINTCFPTRICPRVSEQNRFGFPGRRRRVSSSLDSITMMSPFVRTDCGRVAF